MHGPTRPRTREGTIHPNGNIHRLRPKAAAQRRQSGRVSGRCRREARSGGTVEAERERERWACGKCYRCCVSGCFRQATLPVVHDGWARDNGYLHHSMYCCRCSTSQAERGFQSITLGQRKDGAHSFITTDHQPTGRRHFGHPWTQTFEHAAPAFFSHDGFQCAHCLLRRASLCCCCCCSC